jgi:tetratricopeptide (TPR) repeat protein
MKRLILLIAALLLVGCSGPTKQGKIARADAHQRMDVVNADLAAQQALQQFEVGQLEAAISTIDAAIARYDDNASYHLLRGRILIEQHKLDSARKALLRSAEIDSKVAEAHYFLGVLHQRWSEDEEALSCYSKAMECDKSHPQFLLATAETYVALGKFDKAIELLESAGKEFQHQPSITALLGHIYLRNGNPSKAAKFLSDSRLLGNDDSEVLTLLATAQFGAGEYANCLHTITQLEEDESLSNTFKRIKGKCLSSTGRQIQGRDICLQVTRQTPDDPNAWVDLGYISWEMGDYSRLATCGEKISELAPEFSEGPLFEGIVALRLGDKEIGKKLLAKARSDNTEHGIDILLQTYAKNAKLRTKRPITPNLTAKTAEVGIEQHSEKLVEGSQPIVGVAEDSHLAP